MGEATAAASVDVGCAVYGKAGDASAPVEGQSAQNAATRGVASRACINHPGQDSHVAHHVSAFDGLIVELRAFDG